MKSMVHSAAKRLRTCPEQSVVHDEQICVSVDGALNGLQRRIDSDGNSPNGTRVFHLYAVQGTGIVGHLGSAKRCVEMSRNIRKRNRFSHRDHFFDASGVNLPACISARIESTACRVATGIRDCIVGLSTSDTTSLDVPSLMTRGLNFPSFTSRATVMNACGRSITTLPTVISGATPF